MNRLTRFRHRSNITFQRARAVCGRFKNRCKKLSYHSDSHDCIDRAFSENSQRAIFLHIGLSDLGKITGEGNPYEYLLSILQKYFSVIMCPGFTPSFKRNGVYHKVFSRPEYCGTFCLRFMEDATARTNDAIHSILIKGDYDFSECNHQNSFGPNSCFEQLDKNNVLMCNLGARKLSYTHLHYVEYALNVPYMAKRNYSGVMYWDASSFKHIDQMNYDYNCVVRWNDRKILRDMKRAGILAEYNVHGLVIQFFRAGDLTRFLGKKIADNPFYLITM